MTVNSDKAKKKVTKVIDRKRKELGWSVNFTGSQINLDSGNSSRLLSGNHIHRFSVTKLLDYAGAIGCKVEVIVDGEVIVKIN